VGTPDENQYQADAFGAGNDFRLRVSADRDRGRDRQRYMRTSKADLVECLLVAERAYAEMEDRWLRTADDLLVRIMVTDLSSGGVRTHARGCL
jgi:hypothetical protein